MFTCNKFYGKGHNFVLKEMANRQGTSTVKKGSKEPVLGREIKRKNVVARSRSDAESGQATQSAQTPTKPKTKPKSKKLDMTPEEIEARQAEAKRIEAQKSRLIELIQLYPNLYDRKHEDYKDNEVWTECWLDIAAQLQEKNGNIKIYSV